MGRCYTQGVSWKIHIISVFVLIFVIGIIKLIWTHPQIILYLIMGVIAILAYGAIYIVVKAKVEKKRE